MDEVRTAQLDQETGQYIDEKYNSFWYVGPDEIQCSGEYDDVKHIVDEPFCSLAHIPKIGRLKLFHLPNSQNAVHTLGSAPANMALRRA